MSYVTGYHLSFFKTFFKRQLFSRKTFSLQVILSVAVGVGAVTGIQSYKTSLADLIQKEARNLMGADLAFQTPEKRSTRFSAS